MTTVRNLIGWTVCILGLVSCADSDHYLANVSLNDAATPYGRINTDDLPLGAALLWNTKTNEIKQLPSMSIPAKSIERSPANGTKDNAIKGVSETDVAITTPPLSNLPLDTKTTIGLQAGVGSETSLELTKYYHETYLADHSLPNDASTVAWRQQYLKNKYIRPDYVFVFVTADVCSDEAKFYTGTPTDDKGAPKKLEESINLGSAKIVDVSYSGSNSVDNKGTGIPSIVKYQFFTLKQDAEGATPFHFTRIHGTEIDAKFADALRKNDVN